MPQQILPETLQLDRQFCLLTKADYYFFKSRPRISKTNGSNNFSFLWVIHCTFTKKNINKCCKNSLGVRKTSEILYNEYAIKIEVILTPKNYVTYEETWHKISLPDSAVLCFGCGSDVLKGVEAMGMPCVRQTAQCCALAVEVMC